MNPTVDFYFKKAGKWQQEISKLRAIMLDCDLVETLKWGTPCYMHGKHNIVLIHTFKEYCAVLFFKGALLKDPKKLLIQQTENVQSARQMRFTGISDITKAEKHLKAYIYEAIEVEKAGLKVALKKVEAYPVPDEFRTKLGRSAKLRKAFESLTPGRQRAYLLHFGSAKQSTTRMARVEKYIPQILEGRGIDD